MAGKLVALSVAAAALLMASSVFHAADARRGGGGGGGGGFRAGGGGHSMGMRSMGPRSMGPRSTGVRSFSGGNMGRMYRSSGGYATRSYGGGKAFAAGKAFPGKGAYRHHGHKHAHRHHRHRRLVVGIPLGLYGYYGDYAYDGCEWLRQRALYTGSIYWWDRYNACASSYEY